MRLRVRELRTERGLTLQQLAEAVGKSKAFISQLENGRRDPGPQTLEALAVYFRVSIPELFDGQDEAPDLAELIDVHARLSPSQRDTLLRLARALVNSPEK